MYAGLVTTVVDAVLLAGSNAQIEAVILAELFEEVGGLLNTGEALLAGLKNNMRHPALQRVRCSVVVGLQGLWANRSNVWLQSDVVEVSGVWESLRLKGILCRFNNCRKLHAQRIFGLDQP